MDRLPIVLLVITTVLTTVLLVGELLVIRYQFDKIIRLGAKLAVKEADIAILEHRLRECKGKRGFWTP